jgi:hypothetical protein
MAPVFGWLGGGPAGKLSDLLALWGHVKTPTHQKTKKRGGGRQKYINMGLLNVWQLLFSIY